jgi:cobalt transporter subunit CbtA
MIRETALATLLAGLVAALGFAILQSIWLTPLILKGEVYEDRAAAAQESVPPTAASAEHHHDENAWKPQDGLQRTLFTAAADLLMGVGYGCVLIAVYLLWRAPKSTWWGAAYGLGGFIVFFAAPALGLSPELPGTASAELALRQQWWVMIAAATAIGLLLLFSRLPWWWRVLGVAVIVAPHWVPAPRPAVEGSLAPEELQSQFRLATTLCNACFWVLLGIATSFAFRRLVLVNNPAPR